MTFQSDNSQVQNMTLLNLFIPLKLTRQVETVFNEWVGWIGLVKHQQMVGWCSARSTNHPSINILINQRPSGNPLAAA